MDKKLLEILVCPSCKGPVLYQASAAKLVCCACRVAYLIEDDIPVMLENKAIALSLEEVDACR